MMLGVISRQAPFAWTSPLRPARCSAVARNEKPRSRGQAGHLVEVDLLTGGKHVNAVTSGRKDRRKRRPRKHDSGRKTSTKYRVSGVSVLAKDAICADAHLVRQLGVAIGPERGDLLVWHGSVIVGGVEQLLKLSSRHRMSS